MPPHQAYLCFAHVFLMNGLIMLREGNFINVAIFIHKADSKFCIYKHCHTIKINLQKRKRMQKISKIDGK